MNSPSNLDPIIVFKIFYTLTETKKLPLDTFKCGNYVQSKPVYILTKKQLLPANS
jgi:hypothetical protein